MQSTTGTGRHGHGRRSRRAGRQVARRGAGLVRGAEPRPLAAAPPQQRGVPQHDHRSVRERAGGGRAGSRGDERLPFRARVARLSQQRRLPHGAVARRAEVPRRRRADRRDGRQRQQLRDLRERHAGRRLRDQLHQFVRQAGLPPAARRRRHGPLSGPLPESDLQRLRLQDRHRVDRLRDAAVAAVPLPVRARCDAHGQLRQAHAIRDRVPPLLHLPAEHAGRGAVRGRRQGRAGDAGADRGAGAAPAGRSQGRAPPRLLRAVAGHRHAARDRAGRDGLPEPRPDAAGAAAGRDARVRRRSPHVADGHLRRALHRAVHVRQRGARQALRPHGADRVDVREGRRPGARGRADAGDDARARQGDADLDRAARPQDPDGRAVPDRSGAAARRRPLQPRQDRHGRLAARAARATPHGGVVRRLPQPHGSDSASSSKASMPWAAPARWTRWACRSCSRARCQGRATPTVRWRTRRSWGRSWRKASRSASCYVTNNFRFFYGREVEQADACSLARLLVDFKGAELQPHRAAGRAHAEQTPSSTGG